MKMYSISGVHEKYGLTISMIRKLIYTKQWTTTKIGNKNFLKEDMIERYIDRNTVRGSDE